MFKKEYRDWTEYRSLPGLLEIDFHFDDGYSEGSFWENMEEVKERSLNALKTAYSDPNIEHVMFTHGWSTSGRGRISARSVIRGLMRNKEATPFIIRKMCIQHNSVFIAAIKKSKS